MNAATATKKLLEQRVIELRVGAIDQLPEDDDWGVGYKLTEGKETANPLEKPKACSICQRCVWPRRRRRQHFSCGLRQLTRQHLQEQHGVPPA